MGPHKLALKMGTADEMVMYAIVKRHRKGESYASIARIFSCSPKLIKNYIEKWKETYPVSYEPDY